MKTVKLFTCRDVVEAHLLQGALESAGVTSVLHNEHFSTLYRGLTSEISGVDVFVPEAEYKVALRVLEENNYRYEASVCCPRCGSADVSIRLKRGKRWRAVLAMLLSMLAAAPSGNNHYEYLCRKCSLPFDFPDKTANCK